MAQTRPPALDPASPLAHVLVVEDDPSVAEVLCQHLGAAGYAAQVATTAGDGLLAARRSRPDVMLLDLVLPDGSGNEVCRAVKSDPALRGTLVVMVTALGAEIDRVVGFELGADDYVVKPFSARELILRLRALLRQHQRTPAARATLGRLVIDPAAQRVYVDGGGVALSRREYAILHVLVERRDRMQSREAIEFAVWGSVTAEGGRRVDTHVARLRGKLGPARDYVRTDRGVGYGFSIGAG